MKLKPDTCNTYDRITVEYAQAKISETKHLLDLTLDVGLSSRGQLHDLLITLEAMSPGEFKSGGAGWQIRYGSHPTPFGACLIATTPRGICTLHFLDAPDDGIAAQQLRQEWHHSELVHDQQMTSELCDRLFQPGSSNQSPIALHVKGTNFQVQVWRALLQIPFAGITTYQWLARMIDRPSAARAIGNAVGSNPVAYLIPCHRVLRESGALGGYRWGLHRKAALLGWEASQRSTLT